MVIRKKLNTHSCSRKRKMPIKTFLQKTKSVKTNTSFNKELKEIRGLISLITNSKSKFEHFINV